MALLRRTAGITPTFKVGDTVTRLLAGTIKVPVIVTEVTDDLLVCGAWEFDPKTGLEIDDYFDHVVSFLDGFGWSLLEETEDDDFNG